MRIGQFSAARAHLVGEVRKPRRAPKARTVEEVASDIVSEKVTAFARRAELRNESAPRPRARPRGTLEEVESRSAMLCSFGSRHSPGTRRRCWAALSHRMRDAVAS